MLHTFFNWLRFDVQNLIPEVWWCVCILWAVLLIISIVDVVTSPLGAAGKVGWLALILLLPLLGLFAYCIFCLWRADYYMFEFLFRGRKNPRTAKSGKLNPTANLP